MLGVTILGNNSAVPAYDRHPTSQIVTIGNELIMLDCGEGTQIQLIKYKIRRSKISTILISHLHGDHYFGLIGLITSFGLLGRTQPLTVFAPGNLKQIIELQLKAGDVHLPYDLIIQEISTEGILMETNKYSISCFKTNHRVVCFGFSIQEVKNPRKINTEKVITYEIPSSFYNSLQLGEDYTNKQGNVIKNELVTTANSKGKKYCFCADTKYDESILPHIQYADLLYHETTYLDNLKHKAEERFHSTSSDAATIALKANAKQLLIGHFSSKYENDKLTDFEMEAKQIFDNTKIAREGVSFFA
jgi:ribonuclease Z